MDCQWEDSIQLWPPCLPSYTYKEADVWLALQIQKYHINMNILKSIFVKRSQRFYSSILGSNFNFTQFHVICCFSFLSVFSFFPSGCWKPPWERGDIWVLMCVIGRMGVCFPVLSVKIGAGVNWGLQSNFECWNCVKYFGVVRVLNAVNGRQMLW